MQDQIRLLTICDAGQILEIYSYYVKNTVITFEYSIPSVPEFRKRIENIAQFYPWLVYESEDKIVGYAYACQHRKREAYKWSADVAIYVDNGYHRKGIGIALYCKLFELLKQQGFYNAYAGIALPNEKSVGLHEKLGFQKIAEYNKVGHKFDNWWNVGWWELELLEKGVNDPLPPKSITKIDTSIL